MISQNLAGLAGQLLGPVPAAAAPTAAGAEVLAAALAAIAGFAGWAVHATVLYRRLQLSRHDPVTGLATRAAWTAQASKLLRRGRRTVVLIDLDRFKEINDTYGHAAGDHLLFITAARLRAWADMAGGGTCGRLGGDEFTVLTRVPLTAAHLDRLAEVLASPVTLPDGATIRAAASAGACPAAGRAALSAALGAADEAMYAAKQAGGGRWAAVTAASASASPRRRPRRHRPGSPNRERSAQ